MTITVTPEMRAKIGEIADREGVAMNTVIQRWINASLAEDGEHEASTC